eukprot:768282-Hanusia_phi.AAC.2
MLIEPRGWLAVAATFALLCCCSALPIGGKLLDHLSPSPAGGDVWVLLVAGSSGYMNYRHQADVCHAYHSIRARGVREDRIVVMLFDDVVRSWFNTRRGYLYNEPDGVDVYAGVPKDYTGHQITPKNFLAVLRGDAAAMKGVGTGRVIASGPSDRIFVYFADHGAPGMLAFPSHHLIVPTKLYARDLIATLEKMHQQQKYAEMVLYIEACESGSMFDGLLREDLNILAVTAASPFESSFACYYNNTLGTFLGDCFSNHWLEHEDETSVSTETIDDEVERVKTVTNTSHVCVYGDTRCDHPSSSLLSCLVTPQHLPTIPRRFFGSQVETLHYSPSCRYGQSTGGGNIQQRCTRDSPQAPNPPAYTLLVTHLWSRRRLADLEEGSGHVDKSSDIRKSSKTTLGPTSSLWSLLGYSLPSLPVLLNLTPFTRQCPRCRWTSARTSTPQPGLHTPALPMLVLLMESKKQNLPQDCHSKAVPDFS